MTKFPNGLTAYLDSLEAICIKIDAKIVDRNRSGTLGTKRGRKLRFRTPLGVKQSSLRHKKEMCDDSQICRLCPSLP